MLVLTHVTPDECAHWGVHLFVVARRTRFQRMCDFERRWWRFARAAVPASRDHTRSGTPMKGAQSETERSENDRSVLIRRTTALSFIKKYAWYGSAVAASLVLALALLITSAPRTADAAITAIFIGSAAGNPPVTATQNGA